MATRRRKVRRLRASRTHGWGVSGQHRKSGMRGGHGISGRFRHKKSAVIRGFLPPIGKKGFTPVRPKEETPINLGSILDSLSNFSAKGAVTERSGKTVLDLTKLGYTKLLGEGKLRKPITIIVRRTSESAKRKVEEAGGTIELSAKSKR